METLIKELHAVYLAKYTKMQHMNPAIAAQYAVADIVADLKYDPANAEQRLREEIEDASKAP